jgi:hypothetical protein
LKNWFSNAIIALKSNGTVSDFCFKIRSSKQKLRSAFDEKTKNSQFFKDRPRDTNSSAKQNSYACMHSALLLHREQNHISHKAPVKAYDSHFRMRTLKIFRTYAGTTF